MKDLKKRMLLSRAETKFNTTEVTRQTHNETTGITTYTFNSERGMVQIDDTVVQDKLEEFMKTIEQIPVKTGEKTRIAFLVESFFISNASGIYTFVKHFAEMCAQQDIYLDLIIDASENFSLPTGFNDTNVSVFAHFDSLDNSNSLLAFGLQYEDEVRVTALESSVTGYLEKFSPDVVVAHSYATTKVLSRWKTDTKRIAYTHIGDIMDANNTDLLDFGSELTIAYIELLRTLDFAVGTQTTSSQSALQALLPDVEVLLLPEPYYEPKVVYQTSDKRKGVLIVSSNYERKRFATMFEVLAISGLPVTVITGFDGGEVSLEDMAKEAGVQGYRQLNNVPNDFLVGLIKQHKCLLHLSDIEVMPYAILEASGHIPCVVNGKAPWAKEGLPVPHYPVDPEDLFECVTVLTEVYGDTFEYRGLDIGAYSDNVEQAWLAECK